jgi:hypothetical protein
MIASLLTACATPPKPETFFQLTTASAKHKALQSRIIDASKEKELLSASAAVLQDLGFQIEESVVDAGMLRAVKERSAREYGQEIGRTFVFLLGIFAQSAIIMPIDLHQQIAATLIMHPIDNSRSRFNVRIAFYRTIWQSDGMADRQSIPPGFQRMEMIYDPLIYQQFFSKLSKSVFLEIHQI